MTPDKLQGDDGGPEDDLAARTARLREAFVDQVWRALSAFGVVAIVCLPLRANQEHVWSLLTVNNICLCVFLVLVFPLHRRLPAGPRTLLPIGILMIGATIGTYRTGLQGVGVVVLVVVNVVVAMLFSRRIVLANFAVSTVVLLGSAFLFITHRTKPLFSVGYASSGIGWTFVLATFVTLGFLVVNGIVHYRQALLALSRQVADQMRQIADQRDEIALLATLDTLTGLPNRRLANDRLGMACRQAARTGESIAVLFLDLDGFKEVNDRLGHDAGDEVLKVVAARLTATIRAADTAARLGGDEFLVILARQDGRVDAEEAAGRLAQEIGRPITWKEGEISVGVSIGVALFPEHGPHPDDLLSHADNAMYDAKRRGRHETAAPVTGPGVARA